MNSPNGVARILLLADDREGGEPYRDALAVGGYAVQQAESYVEVLDTPMPDPDMILLCDLAIFAYPAQKAQVLRVPLRAALHATIAQAA